MSEILNESKECQLRDMPKEDTCNFRTTRNFRNSIILTENLWQLRPFIEASPPYFKAPIQNGSNGRSGYLCMALK